MIILSIMDTFRGKIVLGYAFEIGSLLIEVLNGLDLVVFFAIEVNLCSAMKVHFSRSVFCCTPGYKYLASLLVI